MTTTRKVSLTQYLRRLDSGLEPNGVRTLNRLVGLPSGGWPETREAKLEVRDALPLLRSFSAAELIAAVMMLDHADRYDWNSEAAL